MWETDKLTKLAGGPQIILICNIRSQGSSCDSSMRGTRANPVNAERVAGALAAISVMKWTSKMC